MENITLDGKTALITGGARRIGAAIARMLHAAGMNLALHYRNSQGDAERLRAELHSRRPDSIFLIKGDLMDTAWLPALVQRAANRWGRLDLLINNASSFYATPFGTATESQWDDLMSSNLKAPFFIAQAAIPFLQSVNGCIINIVDIHAERPLKDHPVYCAAKAGLAMLTKALALELGPEVRVNGVAPGAILWPETRISPFEKAQTLSRIVLGKPGNPEDIACAVLYLARDGSYVTGQILAVDGGRTLCQ